MLRSTIKSICSRRFYLSPWQYTKPCSHCSVYDRDNDICCVSIRIFMFISRHGFRTMLFFVARQRCSNIFQQCIVSSKCHSLQVWISALDFSLISSLYSDLCNLKHSQKLSMCNLCTHVCPDCHCLHHIEQITLCQNYYQTDVCGLWGVKTMQRVPHHEVCERCYEQDRSEQKFGWAVAEAVFREDGETKGWTKSRMTMERREFREEWERKIEDID